MIIFKNCKNYNLLCFDNISTCHLFKNLYDYYFILDFFILKMLDLILEILRYFLSKK